jgi:hypothetical protein
MPVIRIAEIPNAGPRAVAASSANIGVPQFGGMSVNPQVAQLDGAAALSDTSIRRGAQSMLDQTLQQDAFTAEAEAGIRLGQSIGKIGYYAEQVAEKFSKAKDTADLARAETTMRAAFEKQQTEQLDLPVDKWEENWQRNLDLTRKALSEIKLSNNAATELMPSYERWSQLSQVQIQSQSRKKQLEGFQMDVDANATMKIAGDDFTGAFAVYDRAVKDRIFTAEEGNMRKARIYDDQIRQAKEDNMNRLVSNMNTDPYSLKPLLERRAKGEDVPELGEVTPVQATTLLNNTEGVIRQRVADDDDAADQAVLTGEIKTAKELREKFPNLPERRLLTHESTMSEVYENSPARWAEVAAMRPKLLTAIEGYEPSKDNQEWSRYFEIKDMVNRNMPPGEKAEFLEQLRAKRREEGKSLPAPVRDAMSTLSTLSDKGYFGAHDPKKLTSKNPEVATTEAQKLVDAGAKHQEKRQLLETWAKDNPDKAKDPEQVRGFLRHMMNPEATDTAIDVFNNAIEQRETEEAVRPASESWRSVLPPGVNVPSQASGRAPAAVRYNNPGAMWYVGGWQKKYGAEFGQKLNDGLGQGNQIARFPTPVHGAAAQFHLLSSYGERTVRQGIAKWSGGNNVSSYLQVLRRSGFDPDQKLSAILSNPDDAVRFAQAMASHEAGRKFAMPDEGWMAAYDMFREVRTAG